MTVRPILKMDKATLEEKFKMDATVSQSKTFENTQKMLHS